MNEKKLKQLLEVLDVNSPEAQVVRVILNQYVSIKQIKLSIMSTITQYKLDELYRKEIENGKED